MRKEDKVLSPKTSGTLLSDRRTFGI